MTAAHHWTHTAAADVTWTTRPGEVPTIETIRRGGVAFDAPTYGAVFGPQALADIADVIRRGDVG